MKCLGGGQTRLLVSCRRFQTFRLIFSGHLLEMRSPKDSTRSLSPARHQCAKGSPRRSHTIPQGGGSER